MSVTERVRCCLYCVGAVVLFAMVLAAAMDPGLALIVGIPGMLVAAAAVFLGINDPLFEALAAAR